MSRFNLLEWFRSKRSVAGPKIAVIDANTGLELHEGMVFDNVAGRIEVLEIQFQPHPRMKARVVKPNTTVLSWPDLKPQEDPRNSPYSAGEIVTWPLIVNTGHPGVAFLPS